MANVDQKNSNAGRLADVKHLFGPPPVLSSENAKNYDEMWDKFAECLIAKDFVEQMLIRQVVDATWVISRYVRHDALSVERRFRQSLEFQATRNKDQEARKAAIARALAEKTGRSPTDLARLEALEDVVIDSVKDVDELLQRTPTELEHNRALEAGIGFHEQLDRLITSAIARRTSALEHLELYRLGLGQHLRQASDEIIDATFSEVEEPTRQVGALSLVPAPSEGAGFVPAAGSVIPDGDMPPDGVGRTDASAPSDGGNT